MEPMGFWCSYVSDYVGGTGHIKVVEMAYNIRALDES